jgi:hypothetical protein
MRSEKRGKSTEKVSDIQKRNEMMEKVKNTRKLKIFSEIFSWQKKKKK